MRNVVKLIAVLLLLAAPAGASSPKVTYFLDGARVEYEASAVQGQIEIPLPSGMEASSLRLKPLRGAAITRVEVIAARPDRQREKEIAHLTERKDALADRLKALEVKEEIFRAAAKSQSSKAPRTSKNNQEPLENIRKGTEFALARLEEVFRARRKAENELKSVETKLTSLNDPGHSAGRVARVWLAGKDARVAVSYLNPGLKWTPSYDFRLNNTGEVEVIMHALMPGTEKRAAFAVVPALISETAAELPVTTAPDGSLLVAVFRFPVEQESYSPYPLSALSFSFRNRSDTRLPPGESTCYRRGEYVGKIRFDGCSPGEAKSLDVGRMTLPGKQ